MGNDYMTTTKPTESVDLDLSAILDKMEVIAQVVASERLPNTASALCNLIALARRAPAQQEADERALQDDISELRRALQQRNDSAHREREKLMARIVSLETELWKFGKPGEAALAYIRATQPVGQLAPGAARLPEYTMDIGIAGDRYYHSFQNAHPLPAQWSWNKLWDAMKAAAQAVEPAGQRAVGGLLTPEQMDRLDKIEAKAEAALAELAARTSAGQAAAGPVDPRITAFYKLRDIAERDMDTELANVIQQAIASLSAAPTVAAAGPVASIPAGVCGVPTWHERIAERHPTSDAQYWPDDLKAKYMADEIIDLRFVLARIDDAKLSAAAGDATRYEGVINAGEFDPETGVMRITVKLPADGLPDELRTINAPVTIAAMASPVGAGDKGGA